MKTTLEIPDELFREVKAKAALEGSKLKDFVSDALRAKLQQNQKPRFNRIKFPLIRAKGKTVLSIPDDAASRSEMLEDLKRYELSLR